jgi:tetratricopeptide (TPR) repeat protein
MTLIKRSQRKKIGDLLQTALHLHSQERNQEALKLLNQAYNLAPKDPVILSLQGCIQLKCGLFSEATESCRKALQYNPSDYETYLYLGLSQIEGKEYQSGIASLKTYLKHTSDSSYAWNGLGVAFLNTGQYGDAVLAFEKASGLKGSSGRNIPSYLEALSHTLEPSDLIIRIDTFLEKDPDNIKILEKRHICLHHLGRCDEAEACEDRIIHLIKTSIVNSLETVEMLVRHRKYEDAKELLASLTKEERNQEGGLYYGGFIALQTGENKKAIEILSSGAKQYPHDVFFYFFLGKAYIQEGDYEKALDSLKKAEEKVTPPVDYRVLLCQVLMTLTRYDEAKAIFESEDAFSEKSSLLYDMAHTLSNNRYYDQALIAAQWYTDSHPNEKNGWELLGKIYENLDLYEEAEGAYRNGLEIDHDENLLLSLASVLEEQEEYEDSLDIIEGVLEKNPENYDARIHKGYVLGLLEEYEDAYIILESLSHDFPDKSDVWWNLGWIESSRGNQKEAIEAYLRAIAFIPEEPAIWDNLGYCYEMTGEENKATEAYFRSIELGWEDPELYMRLADLLISKGDYEKSLELYDKIITQIPDDEEVWKVRADLLYELSRFSKALESVNTGLALNQNNRDMIRLKGKILNKMKG